MEILFQKKEFYTQMYEGSLTELVEIFLSFSSPHISAICIFNFWNMQYSLYSCRCPLPHVFPN